MRSASRRRSKKHQQGDAPSLLHYFVTFLRQLWQARTMSVSVPRDDLEQLQHSLSLSRNHIVHLYKQFKMLINDPRRHEITTTDLELHSEILRRHPLKKYIFRLLFGHMRSLTFAQFVSNLSQFTSSGGTRKVYHVSSIDDVKHFTGATSCKEIVQRQKLLSLFYCFDRRDNGYLCNEMLSLLMGSLLRCDSELNLSSLLPPSMIDNIVCSAISNAHSSCSDLCCELCSDKAAKNVHVEGRFEGHRTIISKEMFLRDQGDLHLDQLLAFRI